MCPKSSFLATGAKQNYFTKFHNFSIIIQVIFKFHDFSMHGTLFSDFPGFPELVGTLLLSWIRAATSRCDRNDPNITSQEFPYLDLCIPTT